MEETLNGDMSDIERSQMHFALGKAYEVMKDYDSSFKNYFKGNEVKKYSLNIHQMTRLIIRKEY